MSVNYNLYLTFLTNKNELTTFMVPRAKSTLTDSEVKTAMSGIIASDAVICGEGELQSYKSAELRTVESTEYNVSA